MIKINILKIVFTFSFFLFFTFQANIFSLASCGPSQGSGCEWGYFEPELIELVPIETNNDPRAIAIKIIKIVSLILFFSTLVLSSLKYIFKKKIKTIYIILLLIPSLILLCLSWIANNTL